MDKVVWILYFFIFEFFLGLLCGIILILKFYLEIGIDFFGSKISDFFEKLIPDIYLDFENDDFFK